jgi:Fic family protein
MLNIVKILITNEILKAISEIDEFKGRWQVIENLAPEKLSHLRRIATIESVGSSTRIEGARLSDADVEQLLSRLETKSFTTRDEQEVAGYAEAMDMIFEGYASITITENHIKQLHGVLLKYSPKDDDHRGKYKKVNNHVEAYDANGKSLGIVMQTATPFETPLLMSELIDWYNESVNEESQHPLIIIAIFIVVFLAIHPFPDGNGRLSRIITTLLLLRAGYTYVPYSSMESIIETNKDSNYLALRRTQQKIYTSEQEWEHWLIFFLKTMVKQIGNLAYKVKQEQTLLASLPALSRQIIEMAKIRTEITVKEIEDTTKANRNTIKSHLKKLTEQNYLLQIGKGRGVRYIIK